MQPTDLETTPFILYNVKEAPFPKLRFEGFYKIQVTKRQFQRMELSLRLPNDLLLSSPMMVRV